MRIPETMSAMQLTGHGGLEKLVLNDAVPVPRPAAGEVLIEVSACGMNNTDIKVREGAYTVDHDPDSGKEESESAASISSVDGKTSLRFPRIQGADIAGHIVAVGSDALAHRIGQRVLVDFSIYNGTDENGNPTLDYADIDYIGHGRDGGFAEYVTVPSVNAHHIKTDMSDAELATFGCSTLTAEHMIDKTFVGAGQKVLITGASGGVGSALIQLVRARGATPYAVTSRGKEQPLLDIGAENAIFRQDFTGEDGNFDGEAFMAAAKDAADGASYDVVVDQVGGAMFHSLLRLLKPEGHYVTAGTIAGYMPHLNMHTLYMKGLHIHGSSQGKPEDFARIVRYLEDGKLRPLLSGTFKLSDLHNAQENFTAKHYIGKLVVVPDSKWEECGKKYAA